MVAAAGELKSELATAAAPGVEANLTGAAGMWSDFNEANREAMLKSELISWPVTLAILVLAFGSLVAAGLPLMLTIVGLVASAGVLYLGTLISPISIWAMNFALMFALALGIDYALFVVMRFRNALFGQHRAPLDAVAETMDTAGKAVLFSGITVLISLSAVMLVPSPAFRSVALGIIVAVLFVLAATLTLLPAVLAKLGPRVDRLGLPWAHSGEHRSARFARWGELLWRRPLRARRPRARRPRRPGAADPRPAHGDAFDQGRARGRPVAGRLRTGERRLRPRRARRPAGGCADRARASRARPPCAPTGASPRHSAAQRGADGVALIEAIPTAAPPRTALGPTVERLRTELPPAALVGGPAAENHDLEAALEREDPPGHRGRHGTRLPAPAGRLPGAPGGGDRRARQPALDRRRLRRRQADLPGRQPRRPARLRIAGLPRRLGADLLLRDDLRDRDGLHGLPALLGARALGGVGRRPRGDGRRAGPLRAGHPRRRRGDGRRLLHLRPLRPAAAQGDGGHPRRRRTARRLPRATAAAAGLPAPRRLRRLVHAGLARPAAARRPFRPRQGHEPDTVGNAALVEEAGPA